MEESEEMVQKGGADKMTNDEIWHMEIINTPKFLSKPIVEKLPNVQKTTIQTIYSLYSP